MLHLCPNRPPLTLSKMKCKQIINGTEVIIQSDWLESKLMNKVRWRAEGRPRAEAQDLSSEHFLLGPGRQPDFSSWWRQSSEEKKIVKKRTWKAAVEASNPQVWDGKAGCTLLLDFTTLFERLNTARPSDPFMFKRKLKTTNNMKDG